MHGACLTNAKGRSIGEFRAEWEGILENHGIPEASWSVKWIVEHVQKVTAQEVGVSCNWCTLYQQFPKHPCRFKEECVNICASSHVCIYWTCACIHVCIILACACIHVMSACIILLCACVCACVKVFPGSLSR